MNQKKTQQPFESFQILGVQGTILTIPELHAFITAQIEENQKALVLHINAHALNLAYRLDWMKDFYNQADIVFCDGAGVILAARILGYHISERITYADWMWELAKYIEPRQYSVFFLGARPGLAYRASERLREKFPDLRIAGTHHGFFDKSPESPDNKKILEKINACKPHILIVGFGMPLQEHWLMDNIENINANVIMTGGAVFDYISGELPRAPRWMTDNGFEWLGRLMIDPWRLWKRYILGNPIFIFHVFMQKLGLLKFD